MLLRHWALVLVASFIITAMSAPSLAHDAWISRGQLKNPAGEWCCGEGDCGRMVSGRASAVAGGYEVNADFAIEIEGQPPIIEHYREFVPYAQAQPSPDGAFWRCKRPDGSRRCFFAPPPNT